MRRLLSLTVAAPTVVALTISALIIAVAAPGLGPAPASAGPGRTVPLKFTIDWVFDGSYAPFLLALEKGYYAAEGLLVTIDRGFGSADAVSKVAAGAYNLGFADINTMIEFNARNPGRDLVAVAVPFDALPSSIVTLRREGITRPIDLYGKKLGAPAGSAPRVLWPLFAKAVGMHPASVEWVTMSPPLREPMLLRGEVNAVAAFSFNAFMTLKTARVDPADIVIFPYNEYGLPLYGNAIIAPPSLLQAEPEALRGFVRAITRAWKDTVANPSEAISALKRRDPMINEDVERERLVLSLQHVVLTKDVRSGGFGGVKGERLSRSIDLLAEAFSLPTKPAWQRVFSDKFLPPKSERMLPAR